MSRFLMISQRVAEWKIRPSALSASRIRVTCERQGASRRFLETPAAHKPKIELSQSKTPKTKAS